MRRRKKGGILNKTTCNIQSSAPPANNEAFQNFKNGASIFRDLDAKPALAKANRSFALLLKKLDTGYLSQADQYMRQAVDLYCEMELPDEAGKCVLT